MPSENSIIDSLRNKSAAYNWDFVVAYDREKINHLFMQQFIEKTIDNDNYQMDDISSQYGLTFRDIRIGPPLISFENSSIASSKATVRRKIISGTIIQTDGGQVIRWEYITPVHDYAFLINVDLENGDGVVSSNLEVSINFQRSTIIDIEGINNVPADILEEFRRIFRDTKSKYILGKIVGNAGGGDIIPQKFVVRTQPAPGGKFRNSENYGDGAVLLFIATNLNPDGGSLPPDDYPYLLADGRSAALLMGSRALFGTMLTSHFNSYIHNLKTQYVEPDGNNPPELRFKEGYLTSQSIITGRYSGGIPGSYVSTNYKSTNSSGTDQKAILPMSGFTVTVNVSDASSTTLVGNFISSNMEQYFRGDYSITHTDGYNTGSFTQAYPFNRIGQFDATLSLTSEHKLTFSSISTLELDAKPIDHSYLTIISDEPTTKMAQEFTTALNKVELWTIPDINTFYVQHILFPSDDILTFDRAAIPSDIIMFGNIKEKYTNLRITPAESMLVAGKSLQLTAVPSTEVTWSIDPVGYGTITQAGLYTAPPQNAVIQPRQVAIIAENKTSSRTMALITVVPSAIELDVAALVIHQRTAMPSYPLTAILVTAAGAAPNVEWRLDSDSVLGKGILSQYGVYTPPEEFDDGYVFARAIATLPDGTSASCLLCLISENTVQEFTLLPSYLYALLPGAESTLSTRSEDFEADAWDLYPALGHTRLEHTQEGAYSVYTAFYTAPATVSHRMPVFMRVMQEGKPKRAGHAIIDLTPNTSL